MKISIKTKVLAAALATIKTVAKPSTTHAILGNVQITATSSGITLLGTDLEKQLSITLECAVKEQGSTTVPCNKLHDSIAKARGQECVIESNDAHEMTIRIGARPIAKIRGLDPSEMPQSIATIEGQSVKMEASKFSEALTKTLAHAGIDKSRAILCSVFAASDNGLLTFKSSDGRRGCIVQTNAIYESRDTSIIPRESIPAMAAIADSGEVEISFSESVMSVKSDNAEFATKLIEGNGAQMSRSISGSYESDRPLKIEAAREEFIAVIEYAEIQTMADGKKVFISCDGSKLTARGAGGMSRPEDGDGIFMDMNEDEMAVSKGAAKISFATNPQFLRDSLKCLTGDKVTLEMVNSARPIVMQEPGITCIVMPMVEK